MVKENSGLMKFFTSKKVLFLGFFLILCFILYSYSSGKSNRVIDGYTTGTDSSTFASVDPKPQGQILTQSAQSQLVQPQPETLRPTSDMNEYTTGNTVSPNELLPTTGGKSAFSDFNTFNQGNNMVMPDLLDAGYLIGIDTIGQTLRNPNLELRSDPYIPKTNVGPWNNSTIEPDLARVPLEIGATGN